MNSTQQLGRKKAAVGVGAALLLAASLITVGAAVSAQAGPTAECSNDNPVRFGTAYFGSEDLGNHLVSSGPTERSYSYTLPAGTYEISAVSTDAYEGRENVVQLEEQWFAQFIGADGSVLATTDVTGDVPDPSDSNTGFWIGSIGEVTLDAEAVSVLITHNAPGSSSANSVRPVCIGATPTGDAPVVLDSTITVDFDSENIDPSVVSVVCGDSDGLSDEATSVDLVLDPVAPGTECTVQYPAEHVCTMAVTADGQEDQIVVVESAGMKVITFPTAVSVDVLVDIDCNAPDEGPAIQPVATCDELLAAGAENPVDPATGESCTDVPDTQVLEEVIENPAGGDSSVVPEPQVLQEVTTAPVAQVQPGNPTFTG